MATGKVDDAERARIVATLRETENVRETARRHGRSKSCVSRIAIAEGLDTAGRPQTRKATAATELDAKAMRAGLKLRLLRKAEEMLDATEDEHTVTNWHQGVFNEATIDRPTSGDIRNYVISAAVAIDKSMALERHDDTGDGDLADVDAWAEDMLGDEEHVDDAA